MGRLILVTLALLLAACDPPSPPPDTIRVSDALGGGDTTGFSRALTPRTFEFPADHGPHPGFRHEWWYITGNLDAADGGTFGYHLTFFRIALAPEAADRPSRWAARQVWMGHLALTEVAAGRHTARERIVREALGLAGGEAEGRRIWVEDWTLARHPDTGHWRIDAVTDAFALHLDLAPLRPPVLQGDDGLSQKGAAPGNASYYYSLTRMATSGHVVTAGDRHDVGGLSWLDREWSTSALEPGQAGWDWVSLQLEDGTDIMYYRLRRSDGGVDPRSRGVRVDASGRRTDLEDRDVTLTPLDWWTSPRGERYPVAWEMTLPGPGPALEVRAVLPDQLMDLSVRYWEGAVRVFDRGSGEQLGRGYLEMTGYDG